MSEFRWHLSPYRKFIPEALRQRLWADAEPVDAVPGLELLRLAADEPVLMLAPLRLK